MRVLSLFMIWISLSSPSLGAKEIPLPTNVFWPTTNFQSSYPYVTGETFRALSDHIFDPITPIDASSVQSGDTIFVFFDYLEYFFHHVHPLIQYPYILITHHFYGNSDGDVPGDALAPFLDDDKLIAWFGLNTDRIHPKLIPLPLGVSTPFYPFGNVEVFNACISMREQIRKTSLLYMNFSVHTYPKERSYVYNLFRPKPYCDTVTYDRNVPYPKTQEGFLFDLAAHKFVLSPRGNGLDAFRTWETLLMGSYPIVRSSSINALYEDLPVVVVDYWIDVTEDFLQKKYEELKKGTYNYEKLYMPYWLNLIDKTRLQHTRG